LSLTAAPSQAAGLKFWPSPKAAVQTSASAPSLAAVRAALDERRYVDAGELLDQAVAEGVQTPEVTLLGGELLLARSNYSEALSAFRSVAGSADLKARALEGQGLALSLLGRNDEAFADLKAATQLDGGLWRAWNGLGVELDRRHDWTHAQAAYGKALAAPGANPAIVQNNLGYSLMMQHQPEKAAANFVAALQNDPSLTSARTNLRLALAMQGQYDRASATGSADDRAAVLNNVGVAAAMRGDFMSADKLLNAAISAKGQYYARAADNLQIARDLQSQRALAAPTP
jgi:Flp pilus assembly protein TadD